LENDSYSAFSGANASGQATAIENPWFPPLEECLNKSTPGCIGPNQAIYNALDDLIARLPGVASLADSKIFNLLGNDSNGNKLSTASFIRYLTTRPQFYNWLLSTYCYDALTGSVVCKHLPFSLLSTSVADYFQTHQGDSAATGTPSYPLLTFLRPSAIVYDNLGRNGSNESLIFHEALHGQTGLPDRATLTIPQGILEKLGSSSSNQSCVISQIIWLDVLSQSPGLKTAPTCP